MNAEWTEVCQECTELSSAGRITFPEIVHRLQEIGIERYHVDYSRQEITYYLANGDSVVALSPHPTVPVGEEFSAIAVEAAVRQSQRGEHGYPDFVRKTMVAGCVGYFVQISGQRAIYFGRNGDSHVEVFPGVSS